MWMCDTKVCLLAKRQDYGEAGHFMVNGHFDFIIKIAIDFSGNFFLIWLCILLARDAPSQKAYSQISPFLFDMLCTHFLSFPFIIMVVIVIARKYLCILHGMVHMQATNSTPLSAFRAIDT